MRVVGGEYRGRILKMPRGVKTRPTQDRVREAIFNIIALALPASKVLDLYAGSGAFGIEAISRGAGSATFVENNAICVKVIKENLSIIDRKNRVGGVIKKDAAKAIESFRRARLKFDIVFLDPPYYRDMAKNSLIKIGACDILSRRGFAIAEHFAKDVLPDNIWNLSLFKRKKYGDTIISFYRDNNE